MSGHQQRLQEIYAALDLERPAKRVRLLMEGQEEVKEQLEGLREFLAGTADGEACEGSCPHCRVALSSERSR